MRKMLMSFRCHSVLTVAYEHHRFCPSICGYKLLLVKKVVWRFEMSLSTPIPFTFLFPVLLSFYSLVKNVANLRQNFTMLRYTAIANSYSISISFLENHPFHLLYTLFLNITVLGNCFWYQSRNSAWQVTFY